MPENQDLFSIQNRDILDPARYRQSPGKPAINTDLGGMPEERFNGLTIDQISSIRNVKGGISFDSPFELVPRSELLENKRYANYERNVDLENIYGLQQSPWAQLGNGIVKMAATGAGTFLQGFATLPDTISAINNRQLKDLSNPDGYESDIDNWLKNLEDRFPNYVTRKEKEHPFLAAIPGFAGSANFWGDKIIKNLGFTVGAIGSAVVQDALVGFATEGIGEIPLVANQIGKASLWLNKLFTGTNDIEKTLQLATALGKSEKTILNIKRLGEIAAAQKVNSGFRYGLNIYSSARTEAAVEARDGYRQVKEELINQYKAENLGQEPSGKDLQEIENYATDAMNTRFGVNMALLTVSNALQFDNLFKSFTGGSIKKGVAPGFIKDIEDVGKVGLKEGSLDTFEKKLPTTFMGKVWESVKPRTASIFREGVYEEGGQYAAERGTYDYYTRKYKDPKRRENPETWNTLNEVIDSTVKGLKDQFGTTEGLENMIIGGLSGMLMDAGMQVYDRATGKSKDKRLDAAVNLLNQYGLTGVLSQKYTDTLNSANIAKEMAKATQEGNIFKFKNLKHDMFFAFVNSRLGSNMHDVTVEQLQMLKDLDKEEFEKTFGMSFDKSNKKTVNEYVDALIGKANEIKSISDSVNSTYQNVFQFHNDPGEDQDKLESNRNYKTFENWKTNLIYEGSVLKDTNQRLDSIQQSLFNINPTLTSDLASSLMDEQSLRELSDDYEKQATTLLDTINDSMSFEEKRRMKEQAKQLRTASEIAMMAANDGMISQKDFAKLLNYELNGRDASKSEVLPMDKISEIQAFGHDVNMINSRKKDAANTFKVLSSKEGFEKFFKEENDIKTKAEKEAAEREEVKQRPLPEFTNAGGNKETISLNREYQIGPKKKAKVRKIAADRFKVTSPEGKVTYYPTREKANEAADDINERTKELSKVKILAINADGTIKIEDVKGNIQNINLSDIEGYEKIITEQERLQQFADQLKKDQEEIERSSGDIGTNPSDEETIAWESKKRELAHLFTGGITESEAWENPEGSPIHIQNSRYFLNNARNFPNRANLRAILVPASHEGAYGLAGLTAISYKSEEKDPTKIPGATDPKTGFIAQVFVEQDGSDVYFVDREGKRIGKLGEAIDIDKVVFQAMPAASLEYSDGSQRYRNHQAAEAEVYKKAWEIKRQRLFDATPGVYQLYTFKISRGIPREIKVDGRLERNPVGEVLIDMDIIPTQEGLIQISTTGNLAHQGEQLNFPKGRPILQYEDVFVPLNNRKFTINEAETIFELLNRIGKETVRQSKLPGGPAIRTNRKYARFLQGVLFWKSEITGRKNPNNMYINEKEGNLYLGGKAYDLTNLDASKDDIINHLKETYNNINNDHLTTTFSSPFVEYRMENGDLVEVEWQNYQTYLLSKENPDGSSREIGSVPLVTSVRKATDELQSFEQKYAIMEDLDLPIAEVPKPETKVSTTGTVEVDGFKIDGSVQTYRGFNAGPVDFKGTIEADGTINIEVQSGDTVTAIANNESSMNDVVIANLKAINKLDEKALESGNNEKLVKDFLGLKIAIDLQAKYDAAKNKSSATSSSSTTASPIEISSNVKGFGAVLTNPTEFASSKKNISNVTKIKEKYGNKYKTLKRFVLGRGVVDVAITDTTAAAYPVEFEGQLYADAEAAYQDQKSKYSKQTSSTGSTYELMTKILTAKLQQYPQMVDEIKKQGGAAWLSKCIHQPTTKNSVWETGGQNWFILSLVDAYTKVLSTTPTAPVSDVEAKKADIEKKHTFTRESMDDISEGTALAKKGAKITNPAKVENQLSVGDKVEFFAERKRTGVWNGKFVIEDGTNNPWGILGILGSTTGYIKNQSKINAELAALDEKKPPTPPPPAPSGPTPTVTFEDDDTPEDAFRRLSKGKERSWRTTQGDIEIFKKWAKENVPGIPYEILEQMIDTYDGEKAWGVYEDGVAKFVRGGLRGTEYHEIFEAIWKHFLTDSEKQAIIDEFRTKAGKFTDRESGKKFSYDDPAVTDQMIKERIADDFSDFRLGKIPATTLGGKILQFFKRIIDFIKSFIVKPDLKTKLFQQIDTGRFKTASLQITKDNVDDTFKDDPELEDKVLASYGYIGAYQGTRGVVDGRDINYFTLNENEASDYGTTRKVAVNTTGFIDATTEEYRNLKLEDQKLTGKRVDLMDNSQEGLAKQQQFFNFLMSKGYTGIDNTGFEDSKYLIAFQKQDFEKQAEVPKMLYTKYIRSVQSRDNETNMDKFQQWAKNYGIPEYSRAGSLTETQTHQFVQDLTARAAGIIFKENDINSLYEPAKLTSNELFDQIAQQKDMVGKKAKMGDESWNALVTKTKESLRTLGIEFNEEDRVSVNDAEKTNRDYAPEPFATDWKKYSYFPIKILLATLIETEPMNQSTATELKMPNAKFSTEARGFSLVNFSRTFATLMDKLSNTTDVDEFINKLVELAKEDSRFVRLFTRLGGGKDWKIDFSLAKYKSANWRLFAQFYQTFTKQNPEAIVQYINDNQVYSGSAALTGAVNMTKKEWIENMKALSKKSDSLVTYDRSSKTYKVKNLSEIPIKDLDQQLEFLKKIGVIFDKDAYLALNNVDRNKFGKAVSNIHAFLQKADDIFSVTSRTLNVEGHLNTLSELFVKATNPNQDTTHFNIDGNRTNSFAENNAPSVFENEFNESKTIQELLKKRPELNDVFSKHAILLQLGGPFWTKEGKRTAQQLKIGYIGGTINVNKNKGVSTQRLNIGTRFTQEINQNLAGNYYILIPADSSTEWMMNLGNYISFIDVDNEGGKSAWKKIYSIFRGYLIDEVALALDYNNRKKLHNLSAKRGKELRFFKEILSENLLTKIHNMILDKKSLKEITAEIDSNIGEVNASIQSFINNTVAGTRSNLEKTGKIRRVDENNFSYSELDNTFAENEDVNIDKFKMSNDLINNVLLFANANYIINNIELHKIIFGDPNQFEEKVKKGKVLLDETKRIKSFLSPRRTTFDHAAFRSFLNNEYNKTGLPEETDRIQLKPSDPGYHTAKPYLRTVTAADVNIIGRILGKAKETDGMSWLTIDGYREIKQRNGQWSDDAEKWYQWQMAYMRNRMAAKGDYTYDNPSLEKHDANLIKKKEPIYKLDVLKPIVSGSKYNKNNIDLLLDKFSQMPMYYKAVEGKTLEKLLVKMFNEKIDYIVVQSGRKVGAESLHDLYNPDGSFNNEAFTDAIEVSWKTYGIQVETAYEGSGGQQTMGSQVTKIVTMDLFDNGEPVSKEGAILYKKYNGILTNLFTNGYERLLKDLGIEDLGSSFKLIDNQSISNTLRQEMLRRELAENAKDTIQLKDGEFPIPFEASTSYKQIKDIIYSMVHKAIVSPRMNGGGYVQVPVTMWENASEGRRVAVREKGKAKFVTKEQFAKLSPEVQETAFLTDDTLKFYTPQEPYCEILLPHWFKDKFDGTEYDTDEKILKYLNDSEEGREILKGIAFRIPTQLNSSIESVVIKGFLPQSMGKTVVVPSEIVTKAGSDFDIDKLSMYLKSVYVDVDGNIRLARYKEDEKSTRDFYANVYDQTIGRQIENLERYEGFRDKLVEIFEDIESLETVDLQSIKDKLGEENYEFYKFHHSLFSEIVNQAAENDINPSAYIKEQIKTLGERKEELIAKQLNKTLKNNYVEDMYRRALENEYYDVMYKLITLPENFERLISPVDDAGLGDLADELDRLRGYDESNIKNRILDRNYMTTLRHAFVSAKRWIGIAAVNITHHSLCQKTKVYIDPEMFELVDKKDKKILGDGFIALPHNTVEVNGNRYISLSGRKDTAGNFISSGLSGFATTFVDVAKDPYIMKIIKNELVVGTFMFGTRIGISRENLVMFMNQPIIDAYLTMIENNGDKTLFNDGNIATVRMQFATDGKQGAINTNNFKEAIEQYYQGELTPQQNADQQEILTQFLRLAKMADYSYKMSQATNYDTTRFKSGDALFQKQVRTALARETNIINSVDNILDNSHIGHQALLLDYSMEAIGEIMKLERDEFREITDELLRPFAKNFYMSADDYEKMAIRIKASFLDYIIQTKSDVATKIKGLLVEGGDVLVDRLAQLKVKYPNLQILKDLIPATSARIDGAKSIELKVNLKDAYDENLYVGMMRELRDSGNMELNQFYHDLVTLSILQGTLQSPISIKNIIPIEDYSAQIKDIIAPLTVDEDVRNFSKGAFQRNNWKNDDIFEEYEPKFYQSEEPVDIDPYTEEDIYEYFSYSFLPNKALNLGRNQRMLMFVSENSYASQKDYLKVRRTIQLKDKEGAPIQSWVDMRSATNVFASDFAIRKKRGDLALQNYYGYEKVKYADGTPLTITNSKGYTSYVYRMVNLLGDGMYASEYYLDNRPSAMDNGTVKVEKELTNGDIIKAFTEKTDKANTDLSSPKSLANTITPTEAPAVTEMQLRDGITYQSTDINGTMLENMGYSPLEIADILKQIC